MEVRKTLIETVDLAIKTHHLTNQVSLSDFTKVAQVQPLVVMTTDCMHLEYIKDILQCQLNLFAAYYLQAIALMTKVNDVRIIKTLEQLNPDRSLLGLLLGMESRSYTTLYKDAYKFSLPLLSNKNLMSSISDYMTTSLESDSTKGGDKITTEVNNLCVGKLLNVEIALPTKDKTGDEEFKKVTIPVNVRLMVSALTTDTVLHILAYKTEDISLKERWYAWRAGRISFIKDLILCQDLISEHKKALLKDKSGLLQEIHRRGENAKSYGMMSQAPSLASASNMFVISEREEKILSMKLGGNFSSPLIRNKAFQNTYAMLVCVVDRERERVTFYNRGIAGTTDLSIKEIKSVNKSNGPDIGDILKVMMTGSAPVSF